MLKRYLDAQRIHLQHPKIMSKFFPIQRQYGMQTTCTQQSTFSACSLLRKRNWE